MTSQAPLATEPSSLLGPDDPPAVQVCNPAGAGPAVIVCDHASNAVPGRLDALGLPETALARHIAYDIGAAGMARRLAERLDVPAVLAGYSRLVIDLNRPPEDFTSIREIYDGAVIPGNRRLTEAERQARRAELFRPYHDTVRETLARARARTPHPAVISMHSCTDTYRGQTRPWHIGVLSNRDRRMADRVLQRIPAHRPDLTVGDNKPYSGLDPYGYTIETHAIPTGLPNILFEVRQDLIAGSEGQADYADLLATVLGEVLDDPSLFAPFPG
jgi:predicted N-formylglutamate amidohydrolase